MVCCHHRHCYFRALAWNSLKGQNDLAFLKNILNECFLILWCFSVIAHLKKVAEQRVVQDSFLIIRTFGQSENVSIGSKSEIFTHVDLNLVGLDCEYSDTGYQVDEICEWELVFDVELRVLVRFLGKNLICHLRNF